MLINFSFFRLTAGTKFSAAGREDVDVQMLGRGRPFMIEVVNPLSREVTEETLARIEREVNGNDRDVAIRDLQESNKKDVQVHIKEGEMEKKKNYLAYCCSSRPLVKEDLERAAKLGTNLVINQDTPIRVLHRRSLATRQRTIESVALVMHPSDPHLFTANLGNWPKLK